MNYFYWMRYYYRLFGFIEGENIIAYTDQITTFIQSTPKQAQSAAPAQLYFGGHQIYHPSTYLQLPIQCQFQNSQPSDYYHCSSTQNQQSKFFCALYRLYYHHFKQIMGTLNVYNSVQFHFHIHSEHLLDGKSYAAELHLVHTNAQKKLAVFGVMIEATEGNFTDFLDGQDIGSPNQSQLTLPQINTPNHVYHYQGSLTTPGCGEGVQWFVSSEPLKVKKSNFQKVQKVLNGGKISKRNVQKLNNRQTIDVGSGCVAGKFRQY